MGQWQVHPIAPVFDGTSRVLILGSFPSVKSRESAFFYGHPQNRFWKVMAAVLGQACPETVAEKREMLLGGHVAVWDVIARCEITGSSDSSIRNVTANDLGGILKAASIGTIFCNGATALRLYRKYQEARTGMTAVGLPSTSPANAGWSLERLCTAWGVVGEALEKGTNFDRQGDNFD